MQCMTVRPHYRHIGVFWPTTRLPKYRLPSRIFKRYFFLVTCSFRIVTFRTNTGFLVLFDIGIFNYWLFIELCGRNGHKQWWRPNIYNEWVIAIFIHPPLRLMLLNLAPNKYISLHYFCNKRCTLYWPSTNTCTAINIANSLVALQILMGNSIRSLVSRSPPCVKFHDDRSTTEKYRKAMVFNDFLAPKCTV